MINKGPILILLRYILPPEINKVYTTGNNDHWLSPPDSSIHPVFTRIKYPINLPGGDNLFHCPAAHTIRMKHLQFPVIILQLISHIVQTLLNETEHGNTDTLPVFIHSSTEIAGMFNHY